MSGAWAGGSTRAWRKTRAAVLARDRYRCRLDVGRGCAKHGRPCPGVCSSVATVVHHTRGKAVTGDDPAHLVASCAPCNGHIGEPARSANVARAAPVDWF